MNYAYIKVETKTVNVNGKAYVYREIGPKGGVPIIMLNHLTGTLEDWDPALVDGLAKTHSVVTFDNAGVGASQGITPESVEEMAKDAVSFIGALGYKKVDLLGYSLGGMLAQVIAKTHSDLVRKLVLAGTGPAGGVGISNIGTVFQESLKKAEVAGTHPKHFLFFPQSADSQKEADAFLARLSERKENLDKAVTMETIHAQIKALTVWGMSPKDTELSKIKQPTLIVNGDEDVMIPTENSFALMKALSNAKLSIFPDAGHGAIFQFHELFVQQVTKFLAN